MKVVLEDAINVHKPANGLSPCFCGNGSWCFQQWPFEVQEHGKRERNFDERPALIEGTWLLSFGGCVL